MKNLHFYIQCLMLLLALSLAVLIPLENDFAIAVFMIELTLGIYQLTMSTKLVMRLSKPGKLLRIHNYLSWIFLFGWLVFGVSQPEWMTKTIWLVYIVGIPWVMAIYFVIVIDDLEYHRNYRV